MTIAIRQPALRAQPVALAGGEAHMMDALKLQPPAPDSRSVVCALKRQSASLAAMHASHWQALLPTDLAWRPRTKSALHQLRCHAVSTAGFRCSASANELAPEANGAGMMLALPGPRLARLILCTGVMLRGQFLCSFLGRSDLAPYAQMLGLPLVSWVRNCSTLLTNSANESRVVDAPQLIESAHRAGVLALEDWLEMHAPGQWTHMRWRLPGRWLVKMPSPQEAFECTLSPVDSRLRVVSHLLRLSHRDPLWTHPLPAVE